MNIRPSFLQPKGKTLAYSGNFMFVCLIVSLSLSLLTIFHKSMIFMTIYATIYNFFDDSQTDGFSDSWHIEVLIYDQHLAKQDYIRFY